MCSQGAVPPNHIHKCWGRNIPQHEIVREDTKKTFPYYRRYESKEAANLDRFTLSLYAYDGEGKCFFGWDPQSMVNPIRLLPHLTHLLPGRPMPNVRKVCTLTADMSKMHPEQDKGYWRVNHSLEIFFGGTTLKARLSWKEGVSRTNQPKDSSRELTSSQSRTQEVCLTLCSNGSDTECRSGACGCYPGCCILKEE